MTITELKDAFIQMGFHAEINDLDEVVCVYENEAAAQAYDWFIEIPFDALLFFHVDTDIEAAGHLDGDTLAVVEDIVRSFLVTQEMTAESMKQLTLKRSTPSPCQGCKLLMVANNFFLRRTVITSPVNELKISIRYLPKTN